MTILGRNGLTPDMKFTCCDCGETISGQRVIDGEYLYIVKKDNVNPMRSTFRCEICQEDLADQDDDD